MKVVFSDQYKVPAVIPEHDDGPDEIIRKCRDSGAIFHEEGPDDELFVAVLRPDIGPELWSESALRRM